MDKWNNIFKKLEEWKFDFDFIEEILKEEDAEEVLYNKLVEILDSFDSNGVEENNIVLDLVLLLGELQSEKSLPILFRILNYDEEYVDNILGDTLLDNFPFAIYKVGKNHLNELASFLKRNEISEWNRASVLTSLCWILKGYPEKRKEVIQILRDTFEVEDLQIFLIQEIFTHNIKELESLSRDTFSTKNWDPLLLSEEDLEFQVDDSIGLKTLKKSYQDMFNRREEYNELMSLNTDNSFIQGFGMYEGIEDEIDIPFNIMSDDYFDIPQPRTSIKIGRNDPCPCGSGKKYKKCCGK